jgi:hypothetical protein
LGENLERFGRSIKNSKIENLATLLQLVGFPAMAGKTLDTWENLPTLKFKAGWLKKNSAGTLNFSRHF